MAEATVVLIAVPPVKSTLKPSVISTAVNVFQQRQETKRYEAMAERNHMYRMAQGEIEYQAQVRADNNNGWKDEFVLVIVSLPILVLAYAVFFGDDMMKTVGGVGF